MERDYKVEIPEGQSGDWTVRKFEVTEKDHIGQLSSMFKSGRYVPDGVYTGLYRKSCIIMSDTPDEYRDHAYFIHGTNGRVLIAGLGIGMVAKCVAARPEVTEVIVIEKSPDVIKLVAPAYANNPKIKIIEADIFEYKPAKGESFDHAWFDIWDNLCTDNLQEMTKLKRKFRCCKNKGCWGESLLRRRLAQEKRSRWRW